MAQPIVARRYASALYEEARDRGLAGRIDDDIDLILQSLHDSRELVLFFNSPIIDREKKLTVVDRLLKERVTPLMLRFVRLLVNKGRETLLRESLEAYRKLRDQELGIEEVQARSAMELGERERDELARTIAERIGKKVRLRVETDASLIGGLMVRIGDTVYDGSVRHQLDRLREKLEQGSFLSN